MSGYLMFKTMSYVLLSVSRDIVRLWKKLQDFQCKDCLSVPGLGLKYFNSLRTEDEPIYTYNDKHMRWFVRQAAYGGRFCAFNQ